MQKISTKEVTELIDEMVKKKVEQLQGKDMSWKERYEYLIADLEFLKKTAQDSYNNMKEDGFTVNMIETEGYLRGISDALSYTIDPNLSDCVK